MRIVAGGDDTVYGGDADIVRLGCAAASAVVSPVGAESGNFVIRGGANWNAGDRMLAGDDGCHAGRMSSG